jgi:hypothetical protein
VYLFNNTSTASLTTAASDSSAALGLRIEKYLLFVALEVIVYVIFVARYEKKNGLFYVILAEMLIIPLVKVGASADFCMKTSVPALFILMLMVMKSLDKMYLEKRRIALCLLIAVLLVGSCTPLSEIKRTIVNTLDCVESGKGIANEEDDIEEHTLNAQNFSGSVEGLFFKWLGKS